MAITSVRPHRARITAQGQITVPKAVRDDLGAKAGDELEFERTDGGFVVRHRRRISVLEFAGIAAESASTIPQTAEAIDDLIRAGQEEGAAAHEEAISGYRGPGQANR